MNIKIRKLHINIILFGFVTVLIFLPDLINYVAGVLSHQFFESTFIVKYDWNTQHIPFYEEFYRLIDSGEIAWSWNQFLGINFYASKAYYLLGDPFAWIGYLLFKVLSLSVSNCLFVVTLLKIYVSGILMHKLLQYHSKNQKYVFIFSILFMTSGWVTTFIEQPVFLSFYALSPLMLIATERVLREKKYGLVMVAAALLLFVNYYFTWMFCIFLLLYWIIRYYQLNSDMNFKKFFKCSFFMLGSFIVGVLISGIVWFPSIKHLILSPRLGSTELVTHVFWEYKDLLSIVKNFFVPVFKYDDTVYRSGWYYFYQIGIYCGSIQVLLTPIFFLSKNISKKDRQGYGVLLVCLLATLISPQIGKLFHLTYSLRYTMLFVYILILIGIRSIEVIEYTPKKAVLIIGVVSLCFLCFSTIGFALIENRLDSVEVIFYGINIIFYCLYIALIFLCAAKKCGKDILLVLIALEAFVMSIIPIQSQKVDATSIQYLTKKDEYVAAYETLRSIDSTVYRVYLDEMNFNEGTYLGIPTTSTYDSCYQYTTRDLLYYLREYPDVDWAFSVSGEEMFDLLNVKYIITQKEMREMYYQFFCDKLDVELSGNLSIYKTRKDSSFFKVFSNFSKKSQLDYMANHGEQYYLHELTYILSTSLVIEDELFDSYSQKYNKESEIDLSLTLLENNCFEFTVDSNQDSIVLLSMSYDPGWTATNGDANLNIISVQGGLAAIELPAGNYTVQMEYSVPGYQSGMISCVIGLLILFGYCFVRVTLNKRLVT